MKPCGHCHGTGRCPHPFCIRCRYAEDPDWPGPLDCCMVCVGEGSEFATATLPKRREN